MQLDPSLLMLPHAALLKFAEVRMKKASLPSCLQNIFFARERANAVPPSVFIKSHLLTSITLDMRWCTSALATLCTPPGEVETITFTWSDIRPKKQKNTDVHTCETFPQAKVAFQQCDADKGDSLRQLCHHRS